MDQSEGDASTIPLGPASVPADQADEPSELAARVGRYVIVGELGRGGMGTVLRAYDPKLGREVALKRLQRQDEETEARLVREAQAMARLSHRNVVAVYDVETSHDGATIAMELVRGPTLRRWLREEERPWPQILTRFIAAGRGLAAAHRAGLVHRDFKPANVLLTEEGEAKVTDFGLAKASGAEPESFSTIDGSPGSLDESSVSRPSSLEEPLTKAGLVLGTPRYMAPEQYVGGRADGLSDQYAFCVALWEALCGAAPFRGEYKAMAQRKLEGPPPWPKGSPVPSVVVEAIVRGLQVDRWRRWPTMEPLLEALAFDPEARRRRVRWGLGGVAVVSLVGLVGGQWWMARAERCRGARAEVAAVWNDERRSTIERAFEGTEAAFAAATTERVSSALDEWARAWAAEHTEACEATTIRGEQSEAMLDLRMSCLRRGLVEAEAVVDVLAVADTDTVAEADAIVAAIPRPGLCAELDTLRLGADDVVPEAEREEVEAIERAIASGRALMGAARFDEATEALAGLPERAGAVSHEPTKARVELAIGALHTNRGRFGEAEAHLRNALRIGLRRASPRLAAEAARALVSVVGVSQARYEEAGWIGDVALELAMREGNEEWIGRTEATLTSLALARGDREEAEARIRSALSRLESSAGAGSSAFVVARTQLGDVLAAQGRFDEAEVEYAWVHEQRVAELGEDHPAVAAALSSLAHVALRRGDSERAEVLGRQALELRARVLGPRHPSTARAHLNLGSTLKVLQRYDEAETELLAAEALLTAQHGDAHPDVGYVVGALGRLYVSSGRGAEAEPRLEKSLEILEATQGRDSVDVGRALESLADLLYDQQRYEEAEQLQRRALRCYATQLDAEHPFVGATTFNLARSLFRLGRTRDAEPLLREARRIYETRVSPEHPDLVLVLRTLGEVLLAHDEPDEAIAVLERALEIHEGVEGMAESGARARFVLARALVVSGGDVERARGLAERARSTFAEVGEDELRRDVEAWLAEHPRG